MRIEHRDEPFGSNEKRFYIPCSIFSKCPECGLEFERDLEQNYLSNPGFNCISDVSFYCEKEEEDENGEWKVVGCDHKWYEQIVLRLTVEAAPEEDGDA